MKNKYLNLLSYAVYDFAAAFLSIVISFVFTGENFSLVWPDKFVLVAPVWCFTTLMGLYILKIYNILWRFSGFDEVLRIFIAQLIPFGVTAIVQKSIFSNEKVNIVIYVLSYFLTVFLIFLQRFIAKHNAIKTANKNSDSSENVIHGNVMIIGAGAAGEALVKELNANKDAKVKCIIDDNPLKIGQYLCGVHIVGNTGTIVNNAEKYEIGTIIFAIPTCDIARRTEILNICKITQCQLKILPQLHHLENLNEFLSSVRNVNVEDLLGREPINIDLEQVMGYVENQVVLVTGGGGTIGSELCRQIASHSPKQLVIFDIYENNAYEIQNEIKYNYPDLNLVTLVGSVRDTKRIEYVFKTYKPQIVYHAAAHKHVPLMEDSPNESIKNNVFGTYKTARCADRYGTKRFVLISTDKAVNPTNIMGASKRICEMIIQVFNEKSNTEFVAVRFGNVLGSNGSVIPLFKKQIAHGGPVTVTHPDIIRYFMTVPEAVSLVLQAGAYAEGGEIFVLDMGKPVKILTLAENLIKLSGFKPYKDIGIEFTGLRPGEKLYEEVLMSEEGLKATENELIHIGRPIDIDKNTLFNTLDEMREVMYDENADIRTLVKRIVPTYQIQQKDKELLK